MGRTSKTKSGAKKRVPYKNKGQSPSNEEETTLNSTITIDNTQNSNADVIGNGANDEDLQNESTPKPPVLHPYPLFQRFAKRKWSQEVLNDKEELLLCHVKHWKEVRRKWVCFRNVYLQRYESKFFLLDCLMTKDEETDAVQYLDEYKEIIQ